jgi:hypothetical protein
MKESRVCIIEMKVKDAKENGRERHTHTQNWKRNMDRKYREN